MKREKVLMMIVMCIFFAVGWNSVAMAEDDLNNGLPEVITGMDENGNVYELDTSSGYVDEPVSWQRGGSVKVVNFNTKGASRLHLLYRKYSLLCLLFYHISSQMYILSSAR